MKVLTTDITYLPFGNSMLYLSSIMDGYNGEIVTYKIDNNQGQSLVNDTLSQLDIPGDYIVIKAVFTHRILTINYAKKRALSEVCLERERQLVTHILH
jgi:transposase InsO family protein